MHKHAIFAPRYADDEAQKSDQNNSIKIRSLLFLSAVPLALKHHLVLFPASPTRPSHAAKLISAQFQPREPNNPESRVVSATDLISLRPASEGNNTLCPSSPSIPSASRIRTSEKIHRKSRSFAN